MKESLGIYPAIPIGFPVFSTHEGMCHAVSAIGKPLISRPNKFSLKSTVFYGIYSYIRPRYNLCFVTPLGFVSLIGGSERGADHKTQDRGLKVDRSGTTYRQCERCV